MLKDFLLVSTSNVDKNSCYALYKSGEKIFDFNKFDAGYCPSQTDIGAFGDNWWYIRKDYTNGEKIYYNGKVVYSGSGPVGVAFDNDFLYGNNSELFLNGANIWNRKSDGAWWAEDITLVNGNYAFFVGSNLNYNGQFFEKESNRELMLFGDNWAATSDSDRYSISNLYYDGKYLGEVIDNTHVIFGDNILYVLADQNNYRFGSLIYNGEIIDSNYDSYGGEALFGDHIYYTALNYSVKTSYSYYVNESFIDGKSIGFDNYTQDLNEEITDVHVWPKITHETEFGIQRSNSDNLTMEYDKSSEWGGVGLDVSAREFSFDQIYLYCTNQWK
jgi:hypothetical protein